MFQLSVRSLSTWPKANIGGVSWFLGIHVGTQTHISSSCLKRPTTKLINRNHENSLYFQMQYDIHSFFFFKPRFKISESVLVSASHLWYQNPWSVISYWLYWKYRQDRTYTIQYIAYLKIYNTCDIYWCQPIYITCIYWLTPICIG